MAQGGRFAEVMHNALSGQHLKFPGAYLLVCVLALIFSSHAAAQRIATVTPDETQESIDLASALEAQLENRSRLLDHDLTRTAFKSAAVADPFNMTTEDAKRLGAAMGCDLIVLVRSATLRRSASGRPEYYEAYAAIYVVSSRTGRLIFFELPRRESGNAGKAAKMLLSEVPRLAADITRKIDEIRRSELVEPALTHIDDLPEAGTAAAKDFRSPVPYRRIKPEYTADAAFFDVAATVEIVIDLDRDGNIQRTEIVRWAGFGLDASVEAAVRQMRWRPAERLGKALPSRFLVRYNFRKIDKPQDGAQ